MCAPNPGDKVPLRPGWVDFDTETQRLRERQTAKIFCYGNDRRQQRSRERQEASRQPFSVSLVSLVVAVGKAPVVAVLAVL